MYSREEKENRVLPLAITDFRDIRKRFGIKEKNRRGHMYVVGKTGTGKSTLLANMAIADIVQGNGLALLDPHGDLVATVLDHVPRERVEDVIYWDPADMDYPIGLNPLESVRPDLRHLAASGLIGVFKKIWPEFWGPRLEHILRYAVLALLEHRGSTLLDLPRLLRDKAVQSRVLASVTDPQVREFWLEEFPGYPARLRAEAISPILNKVGQFLATPPLRYVLGQRKSAFRLRKVMDEGKVLLVNLAKGRIGEDGAALLGAMLVTRMQLAAMSRANLPEEERRPFYLYVDEFHAFVTLSFAEVLSEARKYGLSLVLSHQYLEQIDERILAAVLGNVGTLIAFRVGAADAKVLAEEFYPPFGAGDLIKLPNYHFYIKLLIDGYPSRPFSAECLLPPVREISHRERVLELSRQRYGRPKEEVKREILGGATHADGPRGQRLPI